MDAAIAGKIAWDDRGGMRIVESGYGDYDEMTIENGDEDQDDVD